MTSDGFEKNEHFRPYEVIHAGADWLNKFSHVSLHQNGGPSSALYPKEYIRI